MSDENMVEAMMHQLGRRGVICTQTHVEEYKDDQAAMTTVRVVRTPAESENRQILARAIARFLPTIQVADQKTTRARGKVTHAVEDRDAVPTDVIGCNLFLHETKGPHRGEGVEEPWCVVTLGVGKKWYLWPSGKPQRTCVLCRQSFEPIKRDPVEKTTYHNPCLAAAKHKAMDNKQERSLERRILHAATGN